MARIRTIKPEFFTSPDTARVSHAARLLYIAMWSWADDYGRGEMNILQLRAFAFPEEDRWLDSELQSLGKEFQSLCKEVVDGFGLHVYKHRGRSFYQIPSWDSHQKTQRKASSKIPTFDDPESVPDLRFHESVGSSEEKQGSSEFTQGKITPGTGEQGNREQGTGEVKDLSIQEIDEPAKPKPTYSPEFEDWWRRFPKRTGSKKNAYTQFKAALKRISLDDLNAATDNLAAFVAAGHREPRFIKDGERWLKEDRWEEILEVPNTTAPKTNSLAAWGAPSARVVNADFLEPPRELSWPN